MNDPLYVPNQNLNKNISADEINKVIDKLKNKKALRDRSLKTNE